MFTNPKWPDRRFPRMQDHDYSQPGAYFVTICTHERQELFGEVIEGRMQLNPAGVIAGTVWESLPRRFPGIALDASVIMPNHVHGIVLILDATLPYPLHGNSLLGEIVRTFKAATSRLVRVSGRPQFGWQRIYWDVIIRDEPHLHQLRQYIANNPAQWSQDKLYPRTNVSTPQKQHG